MNGSRRQRGWRLVALVGLVWTLAAASAFAENVRIKVGPANVYERPRTTSDVIMTVQEGIVLEVLSREGDWYWVVLPPDGNGTRRSGYVPVYVCERIGDKRVPEPGIPGSGSHGPKPEVKPPNQPRIFVGIGGGGQFGSASFADHVPFTLYRDSGYFDASYKVSDAASLDLSFGVRLGPQFLLTFAYGRVTPATTANVVAKVPHPLNSNQPRSANASGLPVGRVENDGHLQVTYLVPLSNRTSLSVFAGPSIFYLQQDLVSELGYREAYPYDTVSIDSFVTTRKTKSVIGVHVGADLTVMLWRFLGVGVGGRYARGSMNLPSAGTGSVPVDVGGTQLNAGVRLRF
jgi:hypothetical protein